MSEMNQMDYGVVLKKRGNKFVLFIPELGIIQEDTDLKKAYERINEEKVEYIRKMVEFDLEDEIAPPMKASGRGVKGSANKRVFINGITLFLTKIMIILFIGVVAMHFIAGRVDAMKSVSVEQVIYNKMTELYDKIDDMPNEKIERIRSKLNKTAKKFKPLIDDFKASILSDSGYVSGDGNDSRKRGEEKLEQRNDIN